MRAVQTNLVPDRTPFIGRAREHALLAAELERGSRLVTVTGPSGMGKTRLARHTSARLAPRFHGTWFCDLSGCGGAGDLEAVVARVLGIPPGSDLGGALEARGPTLLVLDEIEAVAGPSAAVMGMWLDRAPELRILATSIVPTGAEGEVRFELGPMEPADAVALFLEAARRAWADRAFAQSEATAIAELVERLDGIPLALELAASRIRVLPPRALLARLDERFALLRLEKPGRRRSLVEALSLTWELLEPAEQRALAAASVFAGGFGLESAGEVLGDRGFDTLDTLDRLRGKSLVQLVSAEPPRFALYETVRAFAALKLAESGSERVIRTRHAACFLAAGERIAALADGPQAAAANAWLLAEKDNLLAAHSFEEDPARSARIGLCLAFTLALQGPPKLLEETLASTLLAATRSGDPVLLARALRQRAEASRRGGRPDDAREDFERALELSRGAGDRLQEGLVRSSLGLLLGGLGGSAAGDEHLRDAIAIGRELGDRLLQGISLGRLGNVLEVRGELEPAAACLDEGLAVLRGGGHLLLLAATLAALGSVRSAQGRHRDARRALEEARALYERMECENGVAEASTKLGCVLLAAGFLDEAERELRQGLAVAKSLGNRRFEALAVGNLGLVSLERGELGTAEARLAEALSILEQAGERRMFAITRAYVAVLDALLGRAEEARNGLAESRRILEALGDGASLAVAGLLEGLIELAQARAGDAAAEERARSRLDVAPVQVPSFRFARRLLEAALDRRAGAAAPPESRADVQGLSLGPDCNWFQLSGGPRAEIARRGPIRRLLVGLVEQRLLAPGVGLSQPALAEIGWPGERIQPEAAALRVYNGIRTLRTLGLGEALRKHADGYLLDPALPVTRA